MSATLSQRPGDRAWLAAMEWMRRHEQQLTLPGRRDAKVVFFGDSITEGWAGEGKAAWERHFGPWRPINLGIGGDETQHLLWRMDHGALDGLEGAEKLVLLIGTNNIGNSGMNAEDSADGVRRVVAEIRRRLPRTQILLLAILPRDEKPGTPFRREIAKLNGLISQIEGVRFLDYVPLLLEADGTLPARLSPDALHLSAQGYERLAREIAEELKK